MKNHETEGDFLDELYAQTANEEPPEFLDQAILKQAHTKVSRQKFTSLIHWQRYLSLAAVMVLSIYIFLDVGELSMDAELYAPTENSTKSAVPSLGETQHLKRKEQRLKVIPPSAEIITPVLDQELMFSDELFEQNAKPTTSEMSALVEARSIDIKSLEQAKMAKHKSKEKFARRVNVPEISSHQLYKEESEDAGLSREPEQLVNEIERLLVEGNLVEAKLVYQTLIELYPEFVVPNQILMSIKG